MEIEYDFGSRVQHLLGKGQAKRVIGTGKIQCRSVRTEIQNCEYVSEL